MCIIKNWISVLFVGKDEKKTCCHVVLSVEIIKKV